MLDPRPGAHCSPNVPVTLFAAHLEDRHGGDAQQRTRLCPRHKVNCRMSAVLFTPVAISICSHLPSFVASPGIRRGRCGYTETAASSSTSCSMPQSSSDALRVLNNSLSQSRSPLLLLKPAFCAILIAAAAPSHATKAWYTVFRVVTGIASACIPVLTGWNHVRSVYRMNRAPEFHVTLDRIRC